MKRKDALSIVYVAGALVAVAGIGITALGFAQDKGWIQLWDMNNLTVIGIALVIIGAISSAWARKQVSKRN